MFARASSLEASPGQVEEGIVKLEHETFDALQHIDGFSGIIGCVDRASGRTLILTLWETEDAMRASEEQANQLRRDAAGSMGAGAEPSVERYEVVLQELRTPVHA